jgi:hypothetical protein
LHSVHASVIATRTPVANFFSFTYPFEDASR